MSPAPRPPVKQRPQKTTEAQHQKDLQALIKALEDRPIPDTEDPGSAMARFNRFGAPPTQIGGMVIGPKGRVSIPSMSGAKVEPLFIKSYPGVPGKNDIS